MNGGALLWKQYIDNSMLIFAKGGVLENEKLHFYKIAVIVHSYSHSASPISAEWYLAIGLLIR